MKKMEHTKVVPSLAGIQMSGLKVPMAVVYHNAKDLPGTYCSRLWEATANIPTNIVITRDTLKEIREDIKKAGFKTKFPAGVGEDRVIVETWI